jgi:uncharacterized protein with PIN domain
VNVVDTSAIVAVLFGEAGSEAIERKLLDGPCVMSAATLVEVLTGVSVEDGGDTLVEDDGC